jgi:hypothetical protein
VVSVLESRQNVPPALMKYMYCPFVFSNSSMSGGASAKVSVWSPIRYALLAVSAINHSELCAAISDPVFLRRLTDKLRKSKIEKIETVSLCQCVARNHDFT